jgi:type VI secretion system protein VasG
MIVKDIRILLEKLNPFCVKVLEHAVGSCVSKGNYEVRWEHLLVEFIEENEGDLPLILRRFGVDTALLRKALSTEIEGLRTGNTGKPAFSPPLIEIFEEAWKLAGLVYGLDKITSGALFCAAFEKTRFSPTGQFDGLRSVNYETLRQELPAITAHSPESISVREEIPSGPTLTSEAVDSVLRKYCTNFTDDARAGKLDPVLGRDNEIRNAIDILSRRRKNNPILVGEAGVGKTAVVEGLALRIAAGDVPAHLAGVTVWGLDLGLLQAGASVKGEFEKRLKGVIDAVKGSALPTILFIDEAHTLIGAGGSAGQNDAANLLKPALARGELRTMAATTWSEYRRYFEKDPALARRFQLVKIDEPDEETCAVMLRGVAERFEKHHGVNITHDGILAAVSCSHRYLSGRQLPDKAVDVLDTACTRVKLSQSAKPSRLDAKERELLNVRALLASLEKDRLVGGKVPEEARAACAARAEALEKEIAGLTAKWEREKTLSRAVFDARERLRGALNGKTAAPELEKEVGEALAKLAAEQGDEPMVFSHVSAALCAQVVADWTGIPVGSMVRDEAKTLLSLEERLGKRVIGQEGAVQTLADAVRAAKTGMTNPDAPLGVFLFTGPSGVGKTELALALADELFGGDRFLTVINMSEYQEKHTVSQLKGSPPGYVGYGEGGVLTEAVRQKPYSVVLLDEVEKADIEVMNLFYQVFDKGTMRDGEGREIDFRNTVVIMTSNIASDTIVELCANRPNITDVELTDAVRPELVRHFQPALVGRCTIVPFRPLTGDVLQTIVALKLDKVARRMHDVHKLAFSCSPSLVDAIVASCGAVETGARNAQAVIDRNLLPAVSRQLLTHLGDGEKNYTQVHIGVDDKGEFEVVFAEAGALKKAVGKKPKKK